MTYTATISSKGQVTIPIAARRKFNLELGKKVTFDFSGDKLVIVASPTVEDVWAILDQPGKPTKLSKREQFLSEIASEKYLSKNGN